MLLPLEHSAFVIAANVSELERRFRRLAEEISLVATHLAETEPELRRLTKLCDEIEFAAENVNKQSESAEVQTAAKALSSACRNLNDVLFDFRRHSSGNLSDLDKPHPLSLSLIIDLSDEITSDEILKGENERLSDVFKDLRCRAASLRKVMQSNIIAFYDLGEFFATATQSVASLPLGDRFEIVQRKLTPQYRVLFERCCNLHPDLTSLFTESLDDERFHAAMKTQERIVRDALKRNIPGANDNHNTTDEASPDPIIKRHPYDYHLPGNQTDWDKQIAGGVILYDRPLTLPPQQALVLLRLIKARTKRLVPEEIACVDSNWQEKITKMDEKDRIYQSIRAVVSRLRKSLCETFGISKHLQEQVILTHPGRPSSWELNWILLDQYGFRNSNET